MHAKTNLKFHWENNWQTSAGCWFPGERVVMHGENILETMYGKTWMDILLYGIAKRRVTNVNSELLDKVLTLSGCIPDPRLWNNRVAALAGSARSSSTLGISAATAVSEAVIYGFQPMYAACEMFEAIQRACEKGEELELLIKQRLAMRRNRGRGKPAKGKNREVDVMCGYGRPVVKVDERMAPMMSLLVRHNVDQGEFVQLALRIENELQGLGYPHKLNLGGLLAAIALDQGLNAREFSYYITHGFFPGFIACYDDALKHPEGSFFPVRCSQIDYKGPDIRDWKP